MGDNSPTIQEALTRILAARIRVTLEQYAQHVHETGEAWEVETLARAIAVDLLSWERD